MSENIDYSVEDIEKFLEITRLENDKPQSASLHKLLSVQNKIAIFRDIDPDELKAIIYDLKFVKYKFKDYIIKQGDISENIYFIIQGDCQVFSDDKLVATLVPGIIFGESAAIFKTKRNASVICASQDATLLSFCIDEKNVEFCAQALFTLYKNLASEINAKLESSNAAFIKK